MRVSTLNYPAALFVAAVAAQSLDKPPLQPDLNNLKDGFNANLHPVNGNQSPYQDGMIPQGCKDIVNDEHFDPADIQTVSVQYDDCSSPWILCYHKDSPSSIDDFVSHFGTLPVHTRQFVRHMVTLPADAAHAYNAGGNIAMFGDAMTDINVYLHESGHSLDLLGAYADKPLSSSDNWINNYNQDEDVPDPYSQTNQVENVAQNTVVTSYERNVPGGFTGLNPDSGKIFHQWATVDTEQREAGNLLIPGGQCTSRLADSDPVPVSGGGSRLKPRLKKLRLSRGVADGLDEIPPVDFNTKEHCRKSYLGKGI